MKAQKVGDVDVVFDDQDTLGLVHGGLGCLEERAGSVVWRAGKQRFSRRGPVAPLCKIFGRRVITFNLTFREDFEIGDALR